MHNLTRDELKELMTQGSGFCVSLFMPTHRAGREVQQDPIRFKNLLREAEDRLIAAGQQATEAEGLLKPARQILNDSDFWRHQSDGLAVYLSSEMFRYYQLPLSFQELVIVSHRFHCKPLLRLANGDRQFYLLALSQHQVRLLEATAHRIGEIKLENIPNGIEEILQYYDLEERLLHARALGGRSNRATVFHGHGAENDKIKTHLLEYFRQIDEGLKGWLKNRRSPLVLAGVDYLFPLYREANTYPYLLSEGVAGNPEKLNLQELHKRALGIVEPYFLRAQQEAMDQYRQLAGSGRASDDLETVLEAAYHGQVESLFIADGVQQWGRFDPEQKQTTWHEAAEPGDEDLLDVTARYTFLNGGTVYLVEPQQVPSGRLLAAVFRF